MSSESPDSNEIMALERETCKQTRSGSIQWVDDYCKDDVLQFSPGQPLIVGKDNPAKRL